MISFIIIGKNEGWRLDKCLKSVHTVVVNDNISNYEIIYVDSKSTDNSIEIAKSYSDVKVYLITGVCNAAIARNIGATEASGDILFFIDGDMEIQSGFLPLIVKNDNEMVYPFISGQNLDILYDEEWNYISSSNRWPIGDKDKYSTSAGGLFIITSELWKSVNGMDTRFKRSQDVDLGLRLASKGVLLCRKPDLLAKHHTMMYIVRDDIGSYRKYTSLLARKHIFNRHYYKPFLSSEYTVVALIVSVIMSVVLKNPLALLLYFVFLLYKIFKLWGKTSKIKSPLSLALKRIKGDLLFCFFFITFYPKAHDCQYIKIA